MKKMRTETLYRKPNLSRRHAEHPIYRYLLRELKIDRPNQVWATDITYIPMRRGFIYLIAVTDWHSSKVLSWRVSNTLTTDSYLRSLLVMGAKAILSGLGDKQDGFSRWARSLVERRGYWKAVVAIAAKNARLAWAVLHYGEDFRLNKMAI